MKKILFLTAILSLLGITNTYAADYDNDNDIDRDTDMEKTSVERTERSDVRLREIRDRADRPGVLRDRGMHREFSCPNYYSDDTRRDVEDDVDNDEGSY